MPALAADRLAHSHKLNHRTLGREDRRAALLAPDPSSPSHSHHPTNPASTTEGLKLSSNKPSSPARLPRLVETKTRSSRKRVSAPDWNEFYKNGLPHEIIVIDDTPEPGPGRLRTAAASYHTITTPTQPPRTRKRKLEEALDGQPPSIPTDGPALDPTTETTNSRPQRLAARRTLSDAKSQADGSDPLANRKRKRARCQPPSADAAEPEKPKSRPIAEYRGLARPVRKARDVVVRAAHSVGFVSHSRSCLVPLHPGSFPISLLTAGRTATLTKKSMMRTATILSFQIPISPASVSPRTPTTTASSPLLTSEADEIRKLLGQGTFGKVVQAFDRHKKELVAIKIIRSVQKYRDAAKIELRVLQTLRQNDAENKYRCIHLRDCFDFHGHTCIVTDLLDSSLFDFLKRNSFVPFPNSHIQSFARQLLTSVACTDLHLPAPDIKPFFLAPSRPSLQKLIVPLAVLHDLGLIHTDLKPENILLCDSAYQTFTYNRNVPSSRTSPCRQAPHRRVLLNSDIRLIDFGSATFQDEYHSSVVSTRHYRAPEIILGLGWSYPCDIWSIGCILVEFFTGDALFQTHDNLEHLAMMEAVFDMRIDADLVRQVNKLPSRSSTAAS